MKSIHTQKASNIIYFTIGLVPVLCAITTACNASAEDAVFTVRSNAVLELTVPSIVNLNLHPTTNADFNTASMNISVGTNNPTGYTLTMTADSDTLTHIGSVIDSGSGNPYTPTILPMLTTGSATGYTAAQFESSTTDAYTLNRWGYKLSTATNFMPMTTGTISLATTNAPGNASNTTLDFAAKVDATKPAGTYQTILNFNAVTNYVPLTCNPTGTTINTIVCMQDLNTSNYDSILASMTVNQQYQLFDNRDEKQYYVAKLADGNIWMTQNLDHDIVTTANFYTPQNTDIPASWTPSTATYATSNHTWNDSYTSPESYDPGDSCWNGTLDPDYETTIEDGAIQCGNDRHYQIGNYYNWTAAVAMNDSSSYTTRGVDVDQSICPAGWRLPTYNGNKSYDNLVTELNLTSGLSGNIQLSPVYFVYSGIWDKEDSSINIGSSGSIGSFARYWSSVVGGPIVFSSGLMFDVDDSLYYRIDGGRGEGSSIRCVARSPKTIQSLTYMQDFATLTSKEKTEVLSSMTQNQQYQLKDNRDEKTYYISKLADGNVWMTQNLDHDIVTTAGYYTYANTDIGHGSTPNTQATWTADTATYATNDTTWSNTTDEPESYDPGDLCWNGIIRDDWDGTIANSTVDCINDKHYHIGNYYNWTAAVAMNDSSSYTTDFTDVDQSICPAGWRLPTYSGNKSYDNLVTALSLTSGTSGNVQSAPAYFVYGGYWGGESVYIGGDGVYWSSVVNDDNFAYEFEIDRGGDMDSQGSDSRGTGNSVRCVLRDSGATTSYIMQEVDEWGDSLDIGDEVVATDNRDGKEYTVARLADGNIWMTQNLDHDIVTTAGFYTYANTDIGHGATPNTSATWTASTATYATNDTTWDYLSDAPESYDPSNLCWNGTLAPDFNGTLSTYAEACGNDKHYHIGNYYNWTAAVAMNDSSSYTTNQQDVDQSICPAGWRLPTYSGNKSYDNLVTALSLTSGTSGNAQSAPAYFAYGGYWDGESYDVGGYGYYWSSVVNVDNGAYAFTFDKDGYMYPQGYDDRDYGASVRCVAR